jgi:uncharacterized protein YlxW (UPF0749 family)
VSECEHNDHTHIIIYLLLFGLMVNANFTDCGGERARLKADVDKLGEQVSKLQDENRKLRDEAQTTDATIVRWRSEGLDQMLQRRMPLP